MSLRLVNSTIGLKFHRLGLPAVQKIGLYSNDNIRDEIDASAVKGSPDGEDVDQILDKLIADLTTMFRENAANALVLDCCVRKALEDFAAAALPTRPQRDFRPRESIIDYLRSDEGFGPWLAAGALNRPLLRELSPKAYMALSNWLRSNKLPDDLRLPTKSELVATRDIDQEALRAARRLTQSAHRSHTSRQRKNDIT